MKPSLLTIGNFDGVHRGHQKLIEALLKKKASLNGAAQTVAVSFEPHPIEVLRPGVEVPRLTPPDLKKKVLYAYGLDQVEFLDFTVSFSQMSAEDFFQKVLIDRFNLAYIAVGENFRFGRDQLGNIDFLRERSRSLGIEVELIPPLIDGASAISSSRVRNLIAEGDPKSARRLLGRPFSIEGKVIRGDGRGRTISIPTANIELGSLCKKQALPKQGVYISRIQIEGSAPYFRAVTNIGTKPTVSTNQSLSIESHLLDFHEDLYGKVLSVEFLDRIRDEMRFPSVEALVQQIHKDIAYSRQFSIEV